MGRGLIHKRVAPFFTRKCFQVTLSGISTPFGVLSQTYGQIIHVLLTRPPLSPHPVIRRSSLKPLTPVRTANDQ